MLKSIVFNVTLSKKEVEDAIFDALIEKYEDQDIDLKQVQTFDSTDFTWQFNESSEFLIVQLDIFHTDLRPIKKTESIKLRKKK